MKLKLVYCPHCGHRTLMVQEKYAALYCTSCGKYFAKVTREETVEVL